ncbi:MAG: ATPase, partial [Novosphingobium sp. 16-62-11]
MSESLLIRIAEALERLVPAQPESADWLAFPAYVWDGKAARGIDPLEAPALDLMQGIDKQKAA